MSIVLWYRVDIAPAATAGVPTVVAAIPGLGLTFSNDILAGGFVLDADITVNMAEGAAVDDFSITAVNLPTSTLAMLRSQSPGGALQATIHLGYFDDLIGRIGGRPVMRGRILGVNTTVGGDGLSRTVITGQEEAGFRLLTTTVRRSWPSTTPRTQVVNDILGLAQVPLAPGSVIAGTVKDFIVSSSNALVALDELAKQTDVALLVTEDSVALGPAVGATPAPAIVDPGTNLVDLADRQTPDPTVNPGTLFTGLSLTVLGDAGWRAGQRVTLSGVDDVPAGPLRAARVAHSFSTTSGYTCALTLMAVTDGSRATPAGGAHGVVDRFEHAVTRRFQDHPAVDIGEITNYSAGSKGAHLADLHYGQTPDAGVVAPSVTTTVDTDIELQNAPLVSAFAFDKVGLMTPVYPKMRAVLGHNRGLVNDALVTGYVWAENPRQTPPPNEPGDHWLALPTELGPDGLPSGKGANDLTDAKGHRVIGVSSLHVLVGRSAQPDVGVRPTPPDDDTLVLEHFSGTTITVDKDGALTITTKQQKLTLTNGQVSLALDGSAVAVS